MELVTLPRSAPLWEEQQQEPAPRPSESAVSSLSHAEEQPVRMAPMP